MEALLSTMENLSNMFPSRMSKFEADLHNNTSPMTSIAGLAGDFSTFRSFVLDILKSLQQQVESLVASMDQLEMQGRRKILLIHGVEEEKKEDLSLKVQKIIQTQLKVEEFTVASNSD
ncbi:unnamed protein product [Arctia plantaginis]|uniref:Uncharacterized protein n=1 Tax=Arctia plantaginis TaxID=874455 RepID=A0A8S0YMA4_ARCPL|nr:unnamed protein product [Arctia plantaginis]